MKPIIDQLSKLGDALVNGMDTNNNGQIEPTEEECGAGKAYESAQFLLDVPLYTGPNRTPPSGK
jgi:hypothetical protein